MTRPGKMSSLFLTFSIPHHCERVRESEVAQSCPTLSDPMDCSPPGSSDHGIFQARVLEWGAIALRNEQIHHSLGPRLATKWYMGREVTE